MNTWLSTIKIIWRIVLGLVWFYEGLVSRFCSSARMKSVLCKAHICYGGHRN